MATLKAEVTDQDEPAVEVPSWGEVSSLPEFQKLSYPEQRRIALDWGEDVKREASYRGEFTEADGKEVDDFVANAVQPDLATKAKAAAEGVIRGGLSGAAATVAGRGAFALPLPPIPRVIAGLGATAAAQIGVDELARRGIERFAPGLTEAAELAPGYASGGQIAGIAASAGPAVARTVKALGTIAKAEGGKAAVQQGARLLAPAAAIGAGVDTGIRAVTGQEITPESVATGAILNTLFAGYGANTRVANFTRDEARGLFQRVMEGKGSLRDSDDLLAILNQMKQQSPEGMPMQDFGRATRTTVDVLGRRASDRTVLERPTYRPPPDEGTLLEGRRGPDPVVQRTPELPQTGVRGNVRGTQADTGEVQRRGVTDEMQQSLLQETDMVPIAPNPRSEGQILSYGRIVGPRQQLPTTERLALAETGVEPVPLPRSAEQSAGDIEQQLALEERIRRSQLGGRMLREYLESMALAETGVEPVPLSKSAEQSAGIIEQQLALEERIRRSQLGGRMLREELESRSKGMAESQTRDAKQVKQAMEIEKLPVLNVVINGKTVGQVRSFEEASKKYETVRGLSGLGSSNLPKAILTDESGKGVAYVSYNGRVWPGVDYDPDAVPLYDPKLYRKPAAPLTEQQARAKAEARLYNEMLREELKAKPKGTALPAGEAPKAERQETTAVDIELGDLMKRRGQAQNKVKGVKYTSKDEARLLELVKQNRDKLFETVDPDNDPIAGTDIYGKKIQVSKRGTYYTYEGGRVRTGPTFAEPGPSISIPRPLGKKGEEAFIDAKLAAKPAELVRRYFTTRGDLPKQMFDIMEARGSQSQAMLKQVDFTLRDMATEAKRLNGKRQLTPQQTQALDDFLRGRKEVTVLPDTLQPIATQMRRQIDNLTEGLIAKGLYEGEMAEVVRSRKGQYLTRSYEKFDNPKFSVELLKQRNPKAYAEAEEFVRKEMRAANANVTEDQVQAKIKILVEGDRDKPITSLMRASGIGKDLGITKRREDIPAEKRFLMGEYTDPVINYARSASRMIHLYQTQKMLNELRDFGMANELFFETPTGTATAQIAAKGSETRSPLNGLYADPELVRAIESFDPIVINNSVFSLFQTANAVVKWGKTVGSVSAQFRNPIANILLEIANGNLLFTGLGNSLKSIWSEWRIPGMDSPQGRAYLVRATQLGVYDNSVFQEFVQILKDAQRYQGDAVSFAEKIAGKAGSLRGAAGKVIGFGNATYRAGDNFFKLMAWESETNNLMKGRNLPRQEAEVIAAERVKNTRPTYSRVPKVIKALRAQPFIGNFISWPSEILRGGYWALRYAAEDMATPGMRFYGFKRLVGITMAGAAAVAVARTGMAILGMNDYKMDALRRFVPRYQKNAILMPTDRNKSEIGYIDISYTDPYEILRGPANAVMAGADAEESFGGALREFLESYVGPSILFNSVIAAYYGKTPQGREIRNPQDTPVDRAYATASYILRQNEPATASQIRRIFYATTGMPDPAVAKYGRIYKPSEEISALLGIRPQTINITKALEAKASRFNTQMSDVSRLFTEEYGAVGRMDRERIVAAADKMNDRRRRLFDNANRDYHAAMSLGLSRSEAISAMRAGGISEANALAISKNKYTDYQISKDLRQTMKETLTPDELRKREGIARELRIPQR